MIEGLLLAHEGLRFAFADDTVTLLQAVFDSKLMLLLFKS
jgi:hypothetical protein